jgi:hypothetical protein
MLSFLNSVSLTPEEAYDESKDLRSQTPSRARAEVNPFALPDSIEDAFTRRNGKAAQKGKVGCRLPE